MLRAWGQFECSDYMPTNHCSGANLKIKWVIGEETRMGNLDLYLVIDVPNMLEALVAKVIEIDMQLFKMIAWKKGATLNLLDYDAVAPSETKSFSSGSGPAPMEINAIRMGFKTPPSPSQGTPHPWLTQEEKECHCQENLCLYCRQLNHMAVNCLKKPSNAQVNCSLTKMTTTAAASASSPILKP